MLQGKIWNLSEQETSFTIPVPDQAAWTPA